MIKLKDLIKEEMKVNEGIKIKDYENNILAPGR